MVIVVDTNVLVGACMGSIAAAEVVGSCLAERHKPLVGASLFAEYSDVMNRDKLFRDSHLDKAERDELLDIFLACCEWTEIYYGWRPNLRDENDNHLIELVVAGGAQCQGSGQWRTHVSGHCRIDARGVFDEGVTYDRADVTNIR